MSGTITFDNETRHYVLRVDGPGNAIARSTSEELLQDFLDYLELREQCNAKQAISQHDPAGAV